MTGGLRLRTLGLIVIVVAFIAGLAATAAWFASSGLWQRHLTRSYVTGITLPVDAGFTAK